MSFSPGTGLRTYPRPAPLGPCWEGAVGALPVPEPALPATRPLSKHQFPLQRRAPARTAPGPSGRPGVPLAVPPHPASPQRRRPPRFAAKRGADPRLPALLRLAAQRGTVTAAAAEPPPDGCPWRLQHHHTLFSRTCPGGPRTAFAMGFELVTVSPCSSIFRVTQSLLAGTAPPRNHPCEGTWLQNGSSLSGLGKGV